MSEKDYWREAFMCAIEEVGLFDLCSKEDFDKGGESIRQSAENQSIAFGWDCIPDPRIAEREAEETRRKREVAEEEKRTELFRKAYAARLGVEPHRLYVNNGDIFVSRT